MENRTGGQEFFDNDFDFDFVFNGEEMYPLQPLFSYQDHHDHQLCPTTDHHLSLPSSSNGSYDQQAQTPSQDHVFNSLTPAANYNSNPNPNLAPNFSSAPQIINFSTSTTPDEYSFDKNLRPPTRTSVEAECHRKAESKRRSEQAQLFASLSKVVPGLRKLDRASILEHATNYLKALQERVRILEEECQTSNSSLHDQEQHNADTVNIDEKEFSIQETITAKISNRSVLITICCKKNEKLLPRIPYEIEKAHLNVKDMRVMPFGDAYFHVTILAEMENEFYGTVDEIIEHLKNVLLNSPDELMQSDLLGKVAALQDKIVTSTPFEIENC